MKTTTFVNNFLKLAMGTAAILGSVAFFNLSTNTVKAAPSNISPTIVKTGEVKAFVGLTFYENNAYFLEIADGKAELKYINKGRGTNYHP